MFLAGLELLPRGCNSRPFARTKGTCITFLFPLRKVNLEWRIGEKSLALKKEKILVEMENILMKMEKMQKMEKVLVILEKNIVTIRSMFDWVV